jgi:LysM repeat protein
VDGLRRRELTRYGAPILFLAAVTAAVLLIKSALSGSSTPATNEAATVTRVSTTRATETIGRTTSTVARYYTIQPGDTLGSVAIRQKTTVDDLLRLNPGIDPNALHAGQRIRIG